MLHRLAGLLALVAATSAHPLLAQLSVRPTVVLLSDAARVADFQVRNDSEAAQEVTIGFRFGYARSDSSGRPVMTYDDSVTARARGMTAWTAAFPRRFVLQPGAEQTVRLTARPPATLSDGVYWTRLVTGAQKLSTTADAGPGTVRPSITVRIEQVTTVLYRHGNITTALALGTLAADTSRSDPAILLPVTPSGSAPFIGQSRLVVKNAAGKVVHEARAPLNAYVATLHRLAIPSSVMARGTYTAEVRVDNERSDVDKGALPKVAPLLARLTFEMR